MSLSDDSTPGLAPAVIFPAAIQQRVEAEGIAAVIAVEAPEDAVPLARALLAGGVRMVELAWRTAATATALVTLKREVPELFIGVGTLLTAEQARFARSAGADFGVSPGFSASVVHAAKACELPFAPGVQTASDLHAAIEAGCRWLKFFPAESSGGLAHLRNIHAPFAHLRLRYIPLGGINENNAPEYLREPIVAAVGGTWIAPATLVRQRAWDEIRQRAAAARGLVERRRKEVAA
jgi:2-dehydro-3-deoxyphosphogluconate aldolase / (4S)-4-hydroxy-2-oxoglutarate aldolase